jgi:hypothetical protein
MKKIFIFVALVLSTQISFSADFQYQNFTGQFRLVKGAYRNDKGAIVNSDPSASCGFGKNDTDVRTLVQADAAKSRVIFYFADSVDKKFFPIEESLGGIEPLEIENINKTPAHISCADPLGNHPEVFFTLQASGQNNRLTLTKIVYKAGFWGWGSCKKIGRETTTFELSGETITEKTERSTCVWQKISN